MSGRSIRGTFMLLLAALIWGMAFVAQTAASGSVGAFTFNAARSFIGAAFLFVLFVVIRRQSKKKGSSPVNYRISILGGALCGAILCVAVNFQQFGLGAYPDGVAVSGRMGFLTASYVVMVSLSARLTTGRKLHPIVLLSSLGCFAGLYMLCLSQGVTHFYKGDIFGLICAVFFTCHVLFIDRLSGGDSVLMSCVQFIVCGALSLVLAIIFEGEPIPATLDVWLPILYTAIFSTGIAYTLQIAGQKLVEPALASIVMSLESVFAALSGWLILSERLSGRELIGCALVFASVLLAQLPAILASRRNKRIS